MEDSLITAILTVIFVKTIQYRMLCCKKLLLMLFSIRLSNGWLLELILTTSKYLLIIELMTFNEKTRVFYNRAIS